MAAPPEPLPPTLTSQVVPTLQTPTSVPTLSSSPTATPTEITRETTEETTRPETTLNTSLNNEQSSFEPTEEYTSTTTILRTRPETTRSSIGARPTRADGSSGSSKGGSGLSSGAIAAIAICSVVAGLILIALVYFCRRRKTNEARSRRDRKLYDAQMREQHQGTAVPVWREQSPITPVPSHHNADYAMQEPERRPRRHRHRRAPPSLSGQPSPLDLPPVLRPTMPYQTTAEAIPYGPVLDRRL